VKRVFNFFASIILSSGLASDASGQIPKDQDFNATCAALSQIWISSLISWDKMGLNEADIPQIKAGHFLVRVGIKNEYLGNYLVGAKESFGTDKAFAELSKYSQNLFSVIASDTSSQKEADKALINCAYLAVIEPIMLPVPQGQTGPESPPSP
jgi:hypothetical protein